MGRGPAQDIEHSPDSLGRRKQTESATHPDCAAGIARWRESRGEPAGLADAHHSREGLGTLPGFPSCAELRFDRPRTSQGGNTMSLDETALLLHGRCRRVAGRHRRWATTTRFFRQATAKDFEEGEATSSMVLPNGEVIPGMKATRLALDAPSPGAWRCPLTAARPTLAPATRGASTPCQSIPGPARRRSWQNRRTLGHGAHRPIRRNPAGWLYPWRSHFCCRRQDRLFAAVRQIAGGTCLGAAFRRQERQNLCRYRNSGAGLRHRR